MFGGDDEEGDFLSPTGGAKLASLFGLDQQGSQGNESFQYTAPKQPRKNSNSVAANQKPAPAPTAPAVLLATAVQAFRYINGQYVKQGKLGAAVLGNHTTKEYKLLLYLSQQKPVAAARVHLGFVFTVQPNNYCTFYDEQRQNWSLMFESDKASWDFCKEVCLAKVNSEVSLDAVLVQDLGLGEGPAVETGDSLEVVYTGWLLQDHAIGQMFDSNQNKDKLLRLKIGAGKVIKGWEEGMLGLKKAGRRLIVIPAHQAYGAKGVPNRVPANSTLVFETELRRVKFSKDSGSVSGSSRGSAAPSPVPSPVLNVENLAPEPPVQTTASGPGRPGDPPLRAKSNSLSEQLANPDATKAKLISRMAKMGQPMLPFLTGGGGQPDSSDSELEDTSGSRAKDRSASPPPVQISTAAPASAHVYPHPHTAAPSALLPVMSAAGSSHAFQPYPYTQSAVAPSQLQPVGQVYPAYMGSSDVTSFLMTEARQHNTEIRLSVGKVADKVDQLSSKMDDLQRQGSLSMAVPSMSMETSMIMHNIQRIIQENDCLKKEVFEKSSRIEEQNRKIGELINQNQRYVEQSNLLLEQRNDSLKSSSEQNQARLLQAEQDKHARPRDLGSGQVRLTEDLSSSSAQLAQLQLEASAQQQTAAALQSQLSSALQDGEKRCQRTAALEAQLEELQEAAERTQAQYRSEKQRRKEMELRVNNMEEEVQDLKTDKESLERTFSERKNKWQAERQRRDEEVEELRKSGQQEVDQLRVQLRNARTSTNSAASEQLSQLQAELEEEWKKKCEQMLASAEEQHSRQLAELTELRDALQDKLTQLQEKFTVLKQSRDLEEQTLLQQRGETEELQVLQQKYTALEQQGVAVREKLDRRVAELEKKLEEEESSGDTSAEVKRVMNGVFHSLRGEFDLGESYSGQAVLEVIVTTIKNVTLQLLSGSDGASLRPSKEEEEEEEEEEESDDVEQRQETGQNVHVNGDGEVREEKDIEADSDSHQVTETQMDQEVAAEKGAETETGSEKGAETETGSEKGAETETGSEKGAETETGSEKEAETETGSEKEAETETGSEKGAETETGSEKGAETETGSETQSQAEPRPQETSESEAQKETAGLPAPEIPTEEKHESADLHDEPDESSPPEDGEEAASERNAEHVGDMHEASPKAFGPPANPPPPPRGAGEDTSLTGRMREENGEEPFFQNTTPANPPAAPSEEEEEEEEEEEMSLKGRPPPTPLFGDEEEDNDLDWLN